MLSFRGEPEQHGGISARGISTHLQPGAAALFRSKPALPKPSVCFGRDAGTNSPMRSCARCRRASAIACRASTGWCTTSPPSRRAPSSGNRLGFRTWWHHPLSGRAANPKPWRGTATAVQELLAGCRGRPAASTGRCKTSPASRPPPSSGNDAPPQKRDGWLTGRART